ncbi:Hypothetical predicted protein [Pelobates cultripes]|uniref:Uncharacterized protein n=1 Tax=Pelobates cultripes TaxID=61616 RepID=A0AAD1SVG8_PELCU|nr:Hypothetical predicted protein [Pelobates cultripes]
MADTSYISLPQTIRLTLQERLDALFANIWATIASCRHKPAGAQPDPTMPLTTWQPATPGRNCGAALPLKKKKRRPHKQTRRQRIRPALSSIRPEAQSQPGKV